MKVEDFQCPSCESEQFITEPFHYDILEFNGKEFEFVREEYIDEYKIYCRDCNEEVNGKVSEKAKKVILAKDQ